MTKGGGSNYMSPFKCIDRPKKGGGVSTPGTPPLDPRLIGIANHAGKTELMCKYVFVVLFNMY